MASTRRKVFTRKQIATLKQLRLQDLKDFRALGKRAQVAIREPGPERQPGISLIEEFAAAEGRSRSRIDQACQFARLYADPKVFADLCKLRTPQKLPLTIGHVIPTLSMEEDQRRQLLATAAAEGWSTAALRLSLSRRRKSPRSEGGRPPHRPTTVPEALLQFVKESKRWTRFCEEVWFGEAGVLTSPALQRSSRKLMVEARTSLADLLEWARKAERLLDGRK